MRRSSNWRTVARERIRKVGDSILADDPQVEIKHLRSEISKAYPFGLRENHPYQIWLSEIKNYIQRVEDTRAGNWITNAPSATKGYGANKGKRKAVPVVEGQLGLFESTDGGES